MNDDMTNKPRVIVTGSRTWTDAAAVRVALTRTWQELGQPIVVVQGACPTGADAIAREWAAEHAFADIECEDWPADWRRFGRSAGPIRNADMVRAGRVARVLAFPLGLSRGTRDCMRTARAAGLDVVDLGAAS